MNRQNLVKNGLLDKLDAVFDKCSIQGKANYRTNIDLAVFPEGNYIEFKILITISIIPSIKGVASACTR